jgi:diguanylate cyclase (GGDEF)-like protein
MTIADLPASQWNRPRHGLPLPFHAHFHRMTSVAPLHQAGVARMAAAAARVQRYVALALVALGAAALPPAAAGATPGDAHARLARLEIDVPAFPLRAERELQAFVDSAGSLDPATRLYAQTLAAQAMIAAGHLEAAAAVVQRLEERAAATHDAAERATASLLRAESAIRLGEVAQANVLARNANESSTGTGNAYVHFRAAIAAGSTARQLGQFEDARMLLAEALRVADAEHSTYWQSIALYQQSILQYQLHNGDEAYAKSRKALDAASAVGGPFDIVRAKIAESAALEVLGRQGEELAAMQEGLAIARAAKSDTAETLALTNLADTYLRRHEYTSALEATKASLASALASGDRFLIPTNKANLGFALLGLGRTAEGNRLAEDAVADIERSGAVAEIVDILGEYGRHLADAGDYRGALALRDKQQDVLNRMVHAAQQRDIQLLEARFESERRADKMELAHREMQEQLWFAFAILAILSVAVMGGLYRKVRKTNSLLARSNEELSFLSSRDPLTSLFNRRHFQQFVKKVPDERRARDDEAPVPALLLIDIDHFKSINDRYGHAIGDTVLVAVAQRLRDALRDTDLIVRWGGEEFLAFVQVAHAAQIDEIAQRVLGAIGSQPVATENHAVKVTVSIGYLPMLPAADGITLDWSRCLKLADRALYLAKARGRNRAVRVAGTEEGSAAEWKDDPEGPASDGEFDIPLATETGSGGSRPHAGGTA